MAQVPIDGNRTVEVTVVVADAIHSGITVTDAGNLRVEVTDTGGRGPRGASPRFVEYPFTNALTVTINHNLRTTKYLEKITSAQGYRIYAPVTTVDENTLEIRFTEPETGTALLWFDPV
jgi:hypothetical protein